jgi:hypothetical protein
MDLETLGLHLYLQDICKDLFAARGGSGYAHFVNPRGHVGIPDPDIFVSRGA